MNGKAILALCAAALSASSATAAERTLSVIKVSSGAKAGGPSVEDLVRKFRQ